ncbi:FYN-binding protein 1 isoform X1 [Nycticebus coucang]|uniref:FYN-binding protein 1 isoform X1 n=2 Tax=Nycticebus coucang TaxID=9470 RepID=UPI00234DC258|nr:FYN-binding protein 1 isoform X1 [Nycticebus coucang]
MDGRADVKSLMAKFNTGGNPTEEVSVNSRPFKVTGQNSPSGIQAKKNLFNNQGNASPPPAGPSNVPKFGSLKPPLAVKPSSEEKPDKEPKPPFLKPAGVGQRFGTPATPALRDPEVKAGFLKPVGPKPITLPKEDSKPVFPWPPGNKPSLHSANQDHDVKTPGPKPGPAPPDPENEQKQAFPKLAGVKGKFMSVSQDLDPKPLFPKPAFGQKPSLSTEDSQEGESPTKNSSLQKGTPAPLGARTKGGPLKPAKEDLENKDHTGDTSSSPFPGVVLKPTGNRGGLGLSKNGEDKKEDRKIDAAKNIFLSKMNQEESTSGAPPAKFPKAPSKLTMVGPWGQSQEKEKGDKNSATPKQKPLPPLFTLDPPPQKPSRPPNVDLSKFQKTTSGSSTSKDHTSYSTTSLPPPPPSSHPVSQPPLPASHPIQPPAPSLPPRNIKPPLDLKSPVNEENQDGVMHADGTGNLDEEQESEEETYEDIEASKEREKKREKEEKKRLELEKKEQKEKEKKEQEIKKKFKLTGPIQVIHQAKACCDVKGGKTELSFKQGEQIEIIRITDNPEGKWLGRTAKGSYGYIKTTAVEIDYYSLKRKQTSLGPLSIPTEDDQEVYDDVAEQDNVSSHTQSGSGGMFPPPPDDDIYDGIEEEDADDNSTLQVEEKSNTWSWGILKMLKGKDDKKKSIREKPKVSESDNNEGSSFPPPPKQLDMGDEVYDDVDTSDFPAPSAEMSQGINIGKAKTEEKDPKKLKKQEKEEKDFRKKFKYDGEIRVLYSTKVASSLTSKKWGTRDLPVKPGESLEVIQNTDETKVLCRNEEGKYGYVLRSHLVDNDGDDGEIYDDIADGCIYDND